MDIDFRRVAASISGSRRLRHSLLFQGAEVSVPSGKQFHVAWPPRTLPQNARASIEDAVAEFRSLLNDPKYARLRDLYQQAQELGPAARNVEDGDDRVMVDMVNNVEVYDTPIVGDVEFRAVNRKLRAAANYLGLAISLGDDFLCLGDLDASSLKGAIDYLTAKRFTRFRTVVAAHHGTIWQEELLRLHCPSLVVSVGPKLWRHVKPDLGLVAPRIRFTRLEGDIRF